MDEAWKYFEANKAAVLPLLRRKLSEQISAPAPSQLVLLDVGHFLYEEAAASEATLAREALFRARRERSTRRRVLVAFRSCHGSPRRDGTNLIRALYDLSPRIRMGFPLG
jgi:hypothetical protein